MDVGSRNFSIGMREKNSAHRILNAGNFVPDVFYAQRACRFRNRIPEYVGYFGKGCCDFVVYFVYLWRQDQKAGDASPFFCTLAF